jgi:hypothetical protein
MIFLGLIVCLVNKLILLVFFLSRRFLRGLEELHVPKPLREDLGGGSKEFCLAELLNYSQVIIFLTPVRSFSQL